MEAGTLKDLVIAIIRKEREASVSDIVKQIERQTDQKYANTTIATILTRLENEGTVIGEKKRLTGRKKTYYRLQPNAHIDEANSFMKTFVEKFGSLGIRHISELIGNDITEEEVEDLKKRIEEM